MTMTTMSQTMTIKVATLTHTPNAIQHTHSSTTQTHALSATKQVARDNTAIHNQTMFNDVRSRENRCRRLVFALKLGQIHSDIDSKKLNTACVCVHVPVAIRQQLICLSDCDCGEKCARSCARFAKRRCDVADALVCVCGDLIGDYFIRRSYRYCLVLAVLLILHCCSVPFHSPPPLHHPQSVVVSCSTSFVPVD